MGKNKKKTKPQKGSGVNAEVKASGSVAKKASIKKIKSKAVSSNLKRLNLINKVKTEDLDKGYSNFRNTIIKAGKESKNDKSKDVTDKPFPPKRQESKPQPDIDVTMEDFSKL